MHDFYRLELRRGIDKFDSFADALDIYNFARKHVMQNRPYDKDKQEITQYFLKVSFP